MTFIQIVITVEAAKMIFVVFVVFTAVSLIDFALFDCGCDVKKVQVWVALFQANWALISIFLHFTCGSIVLWKHKNKQETLFTYC